MLSPYDSPEQIASAILRGDTAAEAMLLTRYYGPILFILKRRTRDEELARDFCQETFRIALERLRSRALEEPAKLVGFLRNIAINLCLADGRRAARQQTDVDTDHLETLMDHAADLVADLDRERVAVAVRTLLAEISNDRDRKILQLYYLDELDKNDICRELVLSHRHFDKVISRARNRFRELVEIRCNSDFSRSLPEGG